MRCHYHRDRRAEVRCAGCGKALCPECARPSASGVKLCLICLAARAAEEAPAGDSSFLTGKNERGKYVLLIEAAVVIVSLVVIAFQTPAIIKAVAEKPKPVRYGAFDTDKETDACLNNLWIFSRAIQKGDGLPADLVCHLSGTAYRVVESDGDVVVWCPNPGAHGHGKIRVSRKRPVPEVAP